MFIVFNHETEMFEVHTLTFNRMRLSPENTFQFSIRNEEEAMFIIEHNDAQHQNRKERYKDLNKEIEDHKLMKEHREDEVFGVERDRLFRSLTDGGTIH
jgi:hypothetical protein